MTSARGGSRSLLPLLEGQNGRAAAAVQKMRQSAEARGTARCEEHEDKEGSGVQQMQQINQMTPGLQAHVPG